MKNLFLLLLPLSLLTGCGSNSSTENATQSEMLTADIQGHRGCRGLMPENTWPAMKLALELGVTTLEMDAVITADSQVVLSHEPWMGHIIATRPDGQPVSVDDEKRFNIYQMTYKEVMGFDVGLRPHPGFPEQKKMAAVKPRLADIFDSVALYMKGAGRSFPFFNIETKTSVEGDGVFHPEPAAFCEMLMAVIRSKGMEEWVTIQSFDIRTLQYLHEHYPKIPMVLLTEASASANVAARIAELGFVPAVYSPAQEAVTKEMIGYCHENQMRIIPWTVNTRERIDSLLEAGVDGIITDYPNLILPAKKAN